MNPAPEPAIKNSVKRDGLAALAAVLLTGALIALAINHFV